MWRLPAAFPDLPRSAEEACQFFNANLDTADEQQKLFWLQFQDPARSVLLGDRLKQLEELQKMAQPTMDDLCRALWRKDPVPTSYFGLVRRLQEGRDRVDLWKTSTCTKGARQAFAAIQAYYPKLELRSIAEKRPHKNGKEVKLKHYFEKVMPAARIAEKDCKLGDILENL